MRRAQDHNSGGVKLRYLLAVVRLAPLFLIGCSAFQSSVDISSGRQALVLGNYAQALPHFQAAAKLDPGYVTTFTPFPENVWTYIGRCYYGMGELAEARSALDRSVREHPDAILGYVYLGLVQMRQGQVQTGMDDAATGLTNLRSWFATLDSTNQYSCYWDPGNVIRDQTAQLLNRIESKDTSWQELAPELDRLGQRMEQEVNLATRDIDNNNFIPCP